MLWEASYNYQRASCVSLRVGLHSLPISWPACYSIRVFYHSETGSVSERNETQTSFGRTILITHHSPYPIPKFLCLGGEAIWGMGAKFGVSPATGTGSLTMPIATSPGCSSFGPQLTLSYDSGTGNGPFGFGWQLSVPSITRTTDKGLPRYNDLNESDVFVLSGAETGKNGVAGTGTNVARPNSSSAGLCVGHRLGVTGEYVPRSKRHGNHGWKSSVQKHMQGGAKLRALCRSNRRDPDNEGRRLADFIVS
jgi:hypothetical protein